MKGKPLSLSNFSVAIISIMISLNASAQYYMVYPPSKQNINCGYCYQLHDTVSKIHKGGSYSIETYNMGMTCSCSHSECTDPWQCGLNDNLYMGAGYYENYDEPYDEDGRTEDDGTADLNIDH
jgi:hypothetical protein